VQLSTELFSDRKVIHTLAESRTTGDQADMVFSVQGGRAIAQYKGEKMKKMVDRVRRPNRWLVVRGHREAGMAIAEYAIGIGLVLAVVGVLIKIVTDPVFRAAAWGILQSVFSAIGRLIGQ
jgi:hypothetical protein